MGHIKDGIYHGIDTDGNPFFTAEGSASHLEAEARESEKEETNEHSETNPVSEHPRPRSENKKRPTTQEDSQPDS